MKILHVMGGANDGGAEIFFADALLALNNSGINQQAIVNKSYKKIKKLEQLDIPIHQASFNKIFRWGTKKIIEKVISDFKPDIIHYWMGRAASFMIKGSHINIGWHSGYRGVERFKSCDYHLALTKELKLHLIKNKLPEKNIFVLPIYAPYLKVKSIRREVFDTPINSPLLLTLARLHPVKGLDILLSAMVEVPKAYLWIGGSGELESQLKQQVKILKIENRVKFLGWRDDKEALMEVADLFVFPSRNDAFGAVMIEAWAHKIPFIATKAPGAKAYIKNKIDGVLVDIDNPKKLSKAINMTINNIPLQKKLIKNGYKRYKKEFTEKVFALNATYIYKEILKSKK
jgi:glycosyltransferase involved in cell wall biosynthesis